VNIHKNTFSICEPKIINQSNDESYNDFNNAQISKNTDEKNIQTNDEISKELSIKSFDNTNETNKLNITENEDIDDIIDIETEDELNPDITTKQYESINTDQHFNFEPIEQQTDLNKKINQNNITQSTSPKNLENDVTKEYSLDPVKNNKLDEKLVTDEINNNISPTNEDSLHSTKTDSIPNASHQLFKNTNDNIKDTVNIQDTNNDTEKLKTSNTVNDSANKRESQVYDNSLDNNNTKEFISDSVHKKKTDFVPNTPHQVENSSDNIKDKAKTVSSQNSIKISEIQDNNNSKEIIDETLQNNGSLENITQIDNQSVNDNSKQLSSTEEKIEIINEKDKIIKNNMSKDFNGDNLQDYNNISVINETLQISGSLKNITQTDNQSVNDNSKQLSSTEEKIEIINENNVSKDFNGDNLQDYNNISVISETLQIGGYLENITQTDNQSVNDNSNQLLFTEEKIEIMNENNISKDFNGDNLQDYNNISVINEIQNQPDITKTEIDSESQNISKDPSIKPITSNNDQISGKTSSSPTQDIMNTIEIHPVIANKKEIDQCASEGGCSHSIESNQKYDIEKSKLENKISSDNVYENIKPNDNEQLKKYEPKSFVESFGHPDSCSGVKCLKFNRNLEKIIKPPPINPTQKQANSDETSQSANIDFDVEKTNIINEVIEESHVELSFFDYFQNWISSPTTNSINFLWSIFGDYSNTHNGE
jgi:hypothetical protein